MYIKERNQLNKENNILKNNLEDLSKSNLGFFLSQSLIHNSDNEVNLEA